MILQPSSNNLDDSIIMIMFNVYWIPTKWRARIYHIIFKQLYELETISKAHIIDENIGTQRGYGIFPK